MVGIRRVSEPHDIAPYLSLEQLSTLIPFSQQAIRMYVHRNQLREGVHFFKRGRRLIFKWASVCEWIEGRIPHDEPDATNPPPGTDIVPVRRRA
jgi:hypothetical protein